MAEIVRSGYRILFEVRVLHHYHLDNGAEDFNAPYPQGSTLADQEKIDAERTLRLMRYDVRPFLSIAPAAGTQKTLTGAGGIFKRTPPGLVVAVPASATIPLDARFDFVMTLQHADFLQYTALTLRRQNIFEINVAGDSYRYKELVPVFSNSTGTKRTINGKDLLCLSAEIPVHDGSAYPAEAFVVDSNNALYQALRDTSPGGIPSADWQKVDDHKTDRPVYVHQHDAPQITPPGGSPFRGIELTPDLPEDIFALIRIDAMPAATDFQLLSGGMPKTTPPVFEIHFKNRSTLWRYVNPPDQQYLPLTIYGNPGPSKSVAGGGTVKRKKATPAMLTIEANRQLFSDIIE